MSALTFRLARAALLCAALLPDFAGIAAAQPFLPADVGAAVNGYQDDFDGASLASGWLVRGADVYSIGNGVLRVATASGDPNHLLYAVPGYNNSVQEVLARIRVLNLGTGDQPRGGIATCVDPAASPAGGIDLHFRDENLGRHIEILDDARAWGTEHQFLWQNNTWYWLRLRHEPNAASQGGVNDVFGKIWPADGSVAEPAAWQAVYDYIPARSARTGYAGITVGSSGGISEFEVDYVLIKAAGLPGIVVAPNAFVQTSVTITNQPQSQTVLQCRPLVFNVGYSGTPPFTFQWYRDDVLIPGATNSSFTLSNVQFTDVGLYHVVVSNVASNTPYSATSSNATLTVSLDTVRPMLLSVENSGLNQILVTFSEPVTASTANNRFNYSISNASGPLQIFSATFAPNQTNVTLVTTGQVEGVLYTLTVGNITDQCTGSNLILPGSQATFAALAFTPANVGNATPAGGSAAVPSGYNLTGGGRDIGGTNDQFQFSHQTRTGDFSVQVRIDSLTSADAWSEAGLLVREDLNPGGRFASVVATPALAGTFFQFRDTTNGTAVLTGSFPVNYPNTWLQLQRSGNQFRGYASMDGQSWKALGSAAITMPATVYLGFAVSSHNTNQVATAAFRDFGSATSVSAGAGPSPIEPLGQSSRRTSLVISEIMYNPLDRADGRNLEFIELFNSLSTPEDISGWRLDGDADFTFPPNTIIPAGGFLVIATSPADVQAVYGIGGVLGPFSNTNSLPNDRGTIQLRNRIGAVFLEAHYDTESPWPIAADGAGHSLVLARPSYGEGNAEAWAASDAVGGSPGRLDPVTLDPLRNVVINEFLANTDGADPDFIELYNHGNQALDISGCFLSDARNTNKFVVPTNTIVSPRGFVSFNQNQLGFALSSGGERIFFRNAANARVLDAVRFEAQASGVSFGRHPDGAPAFSELASRTPGTSNSAPLTRDIVINEIMYNPISDDSDDEFVELYNRGAGPVPLGGWRMTGGITFTLPGNAVIPANGYLVIARNAAHLIPRYPNLNAGNTVGDYSGALGNSGERIALVMPEPFLATNNNVVTTNFNYVVVDEVTYRDGGRWGRWSDGGGSSLELIDARSDNRLAANWADSDETAKAPWTTVSVSGMLDNGTTPADQLQVLLQGAGECLIDNVEVLTQTGSNVVANSTFESGAAGWTAEGTQEQSGWETSEGFSSARSYHVRATDRGDNQVNRIRTLLSAVLVTNNANTIRANVRWLRGHPEILFRLRGNWHEAAVAMNLPTNLGTPGAPNSRTVPNAPPAIYDVTHFPPVPAANEPVIVTARVNDPDGLSSVRVRYRIDPSATLNDVMMRDDGTFGDVVAGDGLYSATIPGQPAGTLVAFRVEAVDGFLPGASAMFPNDAPTRECLVRFGETIPAGSFPSYRIWMTQATFNTWDARNNLNNTLNDVTFVLGNHRVIYNAGAVFAGSPYIAPGFNTPTGNRCGYAIDFPADEPLLGDNGLNLDWPGGHGNENTAIQEQMAYWITDQADLAFSHRYFIRLTVNGVTDMQRGGVFEAALQPGTDFLKQWSPGDSDGDFFRIDRAFEFDDGGGRIADPEPQLLKYTTPDLVNGGTKKKTEKYRWYWLKRSFDSANDYTNLFVIADALNAPGPEPYTSQTEGLADVDQWMGIFAMEHIINNFDSWGHDIGKNMYMFLPENGRAQIYMFDLDWLMLVSPAGPGNYTATSGPLFVSDDPTVTRMYNHPPFRRAYFRAVQDAVDRAFVASKYEAVMDAKYNALVANGITFCDGQALAAPTAVKTWFSQRRTYLTSQLATAASPFTISGTNIVSVSSNFVMLSGTAPVTVKTIEINGTSWPITWTSVSNWTIRLPVTQPTNALAVVGHDRRGVPVAGASNAVTVVFTGVLEEAPGSVVINEIMYHPFLPGAEFVELFNASSNTSFDLSGWRINGLDYTFPEGSVIGPLRFLVLVRDRAAAAFAYGPLAEVFGEFSGNLQAGGETLTLIKPGGTNSANQVIDKVRYDNAAPWATNAGGFGPSLQLIDVVQDNARVSNWRAGFGWQKISKSGNIVNGTNLLIWSPTAATFYIDDVSLIGPGGTNILANPGFESGSIAPWIPGAVYSGSSVVSGVSHSGEYSLFVQGASVGGSFPNSIIQQVIGGAVQSSNIYALSFWVLYHTNAVTVNMRTLPGNNLNTNTVTAPLQTSPGAVNWFAVTLPAYDPVWLNEVQAVNTNSVADNFGEREPWIEIYNGGTSALDLEGYYLANNYDSNLTQWPFPAGSFIVPGAFKIIWADGQPAQTAGTNLHTNFRLDATAGSLALVRLVEGKLQITDYLNYSAGPGRSYGSFPDGQPFDRREFYYVTAGGTNNGGAAPVVVFINEWMAANTSTLGDPATAPPDFDDWVELYNPGTNAVDLAGYFLTDDLADRFKFEIPPGYPIPPGGFLLVWADGEPGENNTNRIDLHANFQLSRNGEDIGLFGPEGVQIDAVTFGAQTDDVSQGRFPNGAANILSMPTPTPRASNIVPGGNIPPILASIGNRNVHQGQTVNFTAGATDPDVPPQALVFSLDPGAPVGATINASSGAFQWATAGVLAPGTNTVTVRVTDNGVPALSDFETILIVVSAPPRFNAVNRTGNQLTLGWATIPGRTYRVEYSDDLGASTWQPLGPDAVATGDSLSVTVTVAAPAQRFLRVVALQ